VSAKDLASGKEQKITITASSGLSKEDVSTGWSGKPQSHAAEDQRAARADRRAQRSRCGGVNSVEKLLNETVAHRRGGSHACPRTRSMAVRKAMEEGRDVQAIRRSLEEMQRAAQALAQAGAQQGRWRSVCAWRPDPTSPRVK